jgi:hypothetical protein
MDFVFHVTVNPVSSIIRVPTVEKAYGIPFGGVLSVDISVIFCPCCC